MGGKIEKKAVVTKKTTVKKVSNTESKSLKKSDTKKESKVVQKSAIKSKVEPKKAVAKKPIQKTEVKKAEKISKTSVVQEKKVSTPKDYGDDKIIHLDALEHIRLRSGMYIGRLGDGSNQNDGIYVLLKEVIDNAIDEFIMGFGNKIDIEVKDNRVKVRDYGRGIPLGKVIECVSEINTGAKYNDDVFQFSVGMNGVGTKAVNALSSYFRVVSVRSGKCAEAVFEKGKLVNQRSGSLRKIQADGTYFEFVPDESIFGKYNFNIEYVEKRIRNYAY